MTKCQSSRTVLDKEVGDCKETVSPTDLISAGTSLFI